MQAYGRNVVMSAKCFIVALPSRADEKQGCYAVKGDVPFQTG